MKHQIPIKNNCVETFTFDEHVQYAKDNGYCWDVSKACANGVWYLGGSDWAPYRAFVDLDIPIYPSAEMKITFAGWNNASNPTYGYGVYIKGDCGDGDEVILAHLQDGSIGYSVGAVAPIDKQIALMGWTGNVRPQGKYGKHVHWGIKRNGIPVDPMKNLTDEIVETTGIVSEQPEVGIFKIGSNIKLKPEWDYVRLRPVPNYGPDIPILGRFLPDDLAKVCQQDGEMLCILDLIDFKVWLHGGYVEPC